ncbi:MAG: DnaJ domain-containing protein [Deltaproteobacteria bacterium]|nr:DnaJ domain-containing protein [Deltaproteobacteria bacterium]
MEEQDYYEVLRVETSASQQEIKESYRKLAFEYHPDRNRDDTAAARMKAINESYAVLSDPQKRSRYDTLRQTYGDGAHDRFKQSYTEQDIFKGSDIQQIFEEFSRAFGLRGFDEIFKNAYGPQFRSFEFRKPNAFGRVFVGTQGRGQGQGRGLGPGFPMGGQLGRLIKYGLKKKWGIELPEKGKDIQDIITVSSEMLKSGGKISYLCRKNRKELLVSIPPGMRGGQKIRLKGMGEPGKGGAESGDLYVEVQTRNPLLRKISKSAKGILSSLKNLGNN